MNDIKVTEAMAVLDLIEKRVAREVRDTCPDVRDRDREMIIQFRITQVVAIYCAHEQRPPLALSVGPAPGFPGSPLPFLNVSSSVGAPHAYEPKPGSFGFGPCSLCGVDRSLHT